jgi:Domain of unknown function (DUF1905)
LKTGDKDEKANSVVGAWSGEASGEKTGKAMKKYKFKAKIEAGDGGGAYVLFPHDAGKEFATNGKVPVRATFNGVSYTGSLIKYGKTLHVLGMPKAIRDQTGKGPGDTIEVVVWKDEAVRIVEVPAQFEKLMKKEGLLPVFKKLSYTHRKASRLRFTKLGEIGGERSPRGQLGRVAGRKC